MAHRRATLLGATALAAPVAFAVLLASPAAFAACDQAGSTVTCTGTTTNYDAGTQTLLNVTVQAGATVIGMFPTDAISIQNSSGITANHLTNNGTIDGFVTIISLNPGIDTFTNNGVLKVTDPTAFLQSHSLFGTNFTQNASGTFMARVDASGFNDSLLTFNSVIHGKLVAVIQAGLYSTSMTYTVVSAPFGAVTGQFDSVVSSSPFFSASAAPVGGTSIDLTINRIAFNAVSGLSPNQRAVGNALEGAYNAGTPTGDAATFYSNLFAATSVSVYDQLSGAGTSAAQDSSFGAGGLFNTAMLQQGLGWLNGTPGGGNSVTIGGPLQYAAAAKPASKPGYEAFAAMHPRVSEPGRWRAWGAGFAATRSVDGEATTGSADQSVRTAGGAFGVDHQIGADLLLGFAAGGSGSTFSVSSLSTSGRVDGGHLGLYAIKSFGAAYMAATLGYARLDNKIDRTITGVGPTENATGSFASDQLSGRLELGWKRGLDGYSITPFVAVEPAALWQHAYNETSTVAGGGTGVLGLNYRSNTVTSLPSFLGAQLDTRYVLTGGQTLSPFTRAAWVHEFEPDRKIQASFISVPSAAFTVDGARASPNAVRIDTGAALALNRSASLFANLTGEYSARSRTYAAVGGAKLTW